MKATFSIFLAALAISQGALAAQGVRPDDVASIDGIIRAYYEVVSGPAGAVVDVARDRSLHHPKAWVAKTDTGAGGQPVAQVTTLKQFHGANKPRKQGYWEKETDRVVSRSGNMVHVWSSFATARAEGGEPYVRGVNSVTLFHDGKRWWIMGWMEDSAVK
ncbi:MAG: hypothetical protein IPG23_10645 [Burkholderiales bacterium]|nr:hypothetical protein [Burkholderiales bacterium]